MMKLGALSRVDPRTVWPNEAHDFTPWLAAHLDLLGAVLGLDLEREDEEADIGDFAADIIAKDLGSNRLVVIENQLEATDHRHLGQLITYAAGREAGVVVWVCRDFREEHRQALDWLNRSHGDATRFFGVVAEILKIDDSAPAPHFRLVVSPKAWYGTEPSASAEEATGKQAAYMKFFQRLIDELRVKHRFTNARAGQPQNWYSFSAGVKGFTYGISFAAGGRIRAEIYIDTGDADRNLGCLNTLRADSAAMVAALGDLEWEDLPGKRACRIASYRTGSIEDSQERIDEYLPWSVERMLSFKKVFDPRLRALAK